MTKLQNPMTEEQFDVWIAALRSDKYKQGVSKLCEDDHYCCLGVAQKVCNINTDSEGFLRFDGADDDEYYVWTFIPDNIQRYLVNLNDCERFNFFEIADELVRTKDEIFNQIEEEA